MGASLLALAKSIYHDVRGQQGLFVLFTCRLGFLSNCITELENARSSIFGVQIF